MVPYKRDEKTPIIHTDAFKLMYTITDGLHNEDYFVKKNVVGNQ